MFDQFSARHIPALIAGTTMGFGGIWGMVDPRGALTEFGMPPRVAEAPAAKPVFRIASVRTSIIGMIILTFYLRNQMDAVDTCLAVTGAYAGLVDGYNVWKEGDGGYGVFRVISSCFFTVWGLSGWTSTSA